MVGLLCKEAEQYVETTGDEKDVCRSMTIVRRHL
jgi:hypothetical protein